MIILNKWKIVEDTDKFLTAIINRFWLIILKILVVLFRSVSLQ